MINEAPLDKFVASWMVMISLICQLHQHIDIVFTKDIKPEEKTRTSGRKQLAGIGNKLLVFIASLNNALPPLVETLSM